MNMIFLNQLVFDIDISDYDDVRTCCQGAKVCSRCWPLMSIAVKVLKRILNFDFGYDKLLFGKGSKNKKSLYLYVKFRIYVSFKRFFE